jgi:hypothetical protein
MYRLAVVKGYILVCFNCEVFVPGFCVMVAA